MIKEAVFVYLCLGCIVAGEGISWISTHCPSKGEDITITDGFVLAVGWGVLVPTMIVADVFGTGERSPEKECKK